MKNGKYADTSEKANVEEEYLNLYYELSGTEKPKTVCIEELKRDDMFISD